MKAKKTISILLMLTLLLSCLPMQTMAEEVMGAYPDALDNTPKEDVPVGTPDNLGQDDEPLKPDDYEEPTNTTRGTCGENLTWALDENGTLTISGTGEMDGWALADEPWHNYKDSITAVVIEDGVTSIGTPAFWGCDRITSVVIPASVTVLDYFSFAYCDKLAAILFEGDAPDISEGAFYGVTATMYYPAGNTTWTDDVMQDCHGDITWKCYGLVASGTCGENLTWTLDGEGTLTISGTGPMTDYSDWNTDTPWDDYYLSKLVVEEGVTTVGNNAFIYTDLQTIELPDSLEIIGVRAFQGSTYLSQITIPQNVKSIGLAALSYCSNLTAINIPDSVQIIDEAFIGCDRLATVTLGTGACEGLEGSFSNCESLERFVVAEDNTWYSLGEYGELFNKDQTVLFLVPRSISGCYVVPDTVTRIADNAFEECGSLSGLIIPDNVETIGDHAFVCCDGVQGILFAGSAPEVGSQVFFLVDATVYYPADDASWTKEVRENYWQDCYTAPTWIPYSGTVLLSHPVDTTVMVGQTATVSVAAYGTELTYEWWTAPFGSDAFTKADADGNTYSMSMNSSADECQVYCIVTDEDGNQIQSNTAIVQVYPQLELDQPVDAEITAAGEQVFYSFTAEKSCYYRFNFDESVCGGVYSPTDMEMIYGSYTAWFEAGEAKLLAFSAYEPVNFSIEVTHGSYHWTEITKEPTCFEKGETTYHCDDCGWSWTEKDVPVVSHSLGEDGICTICGFDASGLIVINMTDSYGDGWNGCALQIYEDGKLIDNATIENGFSALWMCEYDSEKKYTVCWVNGYCSDECSFTITIAGEVVLTATGDDCSGYSDGEPILFQLTGSNVALGSSLAMNFFIDKDYLSGSDYYAVITHYVHDDLGDVFHVYTIPFTQWEERQDYMVVTLENLAAKNMTDYIEVQVFRADGTPCTAVWGDSVQDYAMRIFDKQDDVTKTLLVDMLNYGAAAQTYFGYRDTYLVNECLTEEQQAYATQSVTCTDQRVKGENYFGSTLVLENRIQLTMYFQDISTDMYAVVSYTDHNGNAVNYTVSGTAFAQFNANTYGVTVETLAVADGDQLVTVTVYDAEENAVASASDTVNGYLSRMMGDDAIFNAVAKFTNAAYAYFH